MEVLIPRGLEEALEWKADHPEAVPIAGGTDLMVDLNFDRSRPEVMIDVSRLSELNTWRREDGNLFLGAGLTYTRALHELPEMRALAQASRSVGSPQIRNRGTIGGNLGTASPAGDAVPVLVAHEDAGTVRVALGSVGPTVLRAPEAEAFVAETLSRAGAWDDRSSPLPPGDLDGFAERVSEAAAPIDDVRGTAGYRRHACRVLAHRALGWALAERV